MVHPSSFPPPDNQPAPGDDRAELFIRLLAENERVLTAYVLTLLPHRPDAEDILQETKLALWRSFQQFPGGDEFWGLGEGNCLQPRA